MRFGVSIALGGELADPRALADLARGAEASGWDGVFVWDHLWNRTRAPFADPFVVLAAIALATERVVIGTCVVALPRRRPQLVAQAATTLDHLSGGRMILGLGLGVDTYGEFSAFDEPCTDDRQRAAVLDGGVELLIPLLAGAPLAALDGRPATLASVQRPRMPIWVAGRSARTAGARRVARHNLEGLALVDGNPWTPEPIERAIAAGSLDTERVQIALVGGSAPDLPALAAAGAGWWIPEITPDMSLAQARAVIAAGPPQLD